VLGLCIGILKIFLLKKCHKYFGPLILSAIILCGHAVTLALVIVFALLSPEFISVEMDMVAVGQIFLHHFIFHLRLLFHQFFIFGRSGSVCRS